MRHEPRIAGGLGIREVTRPWVVTRIDSEPRPDRVQFYIAIASEHIGFGLHQARSEATFLKRLHGGSCTVFATVLGPEANEAHRDHFHLDMKERRSGSGVCH